MPFADSEGIQIYYDDMGEGEPVLLCLPGWCCHHTMFEPTFAERLSANHRVLVMDWRGHGRSQVPERDFGFLSWPMMPLRSSKRAVRSRWSPSPKVKLHGWISNCGGA